MSLGMTHKIMHVALEGRGTVTLRPSDHIATGGEGSIYRAGDSVVKIYLDPAKMRQRGLPEKIRKLAGFKHRYIVAPTGLALSSGEVVGYYMPHVEDPPAAYPLSMVFTNDFYRREGFNAKRASTLVGRMRDTFLFAHDHGA